jgi:acyl-CoA thioesterase-2
VHACVLAYFSDMTGRRLPAAQPRIWGTHTDASLDHAVWFHRPRRADEWSLFDLQALVERRRAFHHTGHHARRGRSLYLSMAQELLIRELDEPLVFETPP